MKAEFEAEKNKLEESGAKDKKEAQENLGWYQWAKEKLGMAEKAKKDLEEEVATKENDLEQKL